MACSRRFCVCGGIGTFTTCCMPKICVNTCCTCCPCNDCGRNSCSQTRCGERSTCENSRERDCDRCD